MAIAWLFPSRQDIPQTPSTFQIADALQVLQAAEDADALVAVLEQWSEVLLSRYTLATLYLTAVRNALDKQEEIAQELSELLHLLGSVHRYGLAWTCQRLAELTDEEHVILLSPTDLAELFTRIRDTLARDEYPEIQVTLYLEIGDQQALIFDETQEQKWLEQAAENYASALSLETQKENPIRWAYIHMRRGIVELYRRGNDRANFVEQAIADLEAALTVDLSEIEPQLRATINQHLAQAYSERTYDQRPNNLRRAIAAYRATLDDLAGEAALRQRVSILPKLADLYVELREEQPAKDAFAEMRQVVQELEQLEREQLAQEKQPQSPARSEPLDSMAVATAVEEWLAITDHEQLFAFLVEQQDILVSDEALAHLRHLLAAEETSVQDGRTEHITCLIQLLENARAFSIDVAWLRYLTEILPALEAVRLLALAETLPEFRRRFGMQWDLISSPAMLATLYMLSRASQEAQYVHRSITFLRQLRSAQFPSSSFEPEDADLHDSTSSAKDRQYEESDGELILKPEYLADMKLDDPYMSLLMQDYRRLSPQQLMTVMPALTQFGGLINNPHPEEIARAAEQILFSLDREQTPYLWANMHWICAVTALFDPQDDQAQAFAHCEAAFSVITRELAPAAWARLLLARAAVHMYAIQSGSDHRLDADECQAHSQQAIQDLSLAEAYFSPEENLLEWAMTRATRAMALAEEARHLGLTQDRFTRTIADFDASIPIMARRGSPWQRILLHMCRARTLFQYRQSDRQTAIARVMEDCSTVITLAQPRSSQRMAEAWADALIIHGMACTERINAAPSENAAQALGDFARALSVYTRATHPQDWALILINRGNVYMSLGTGDARENQEKALQDFSDALLAMKTGTRPKYVGQALVNRSLCLMQRIAGEKVQNQRQALEDCTEALKTFERSGYLHEAASALVNRAGIYLQLLSGDRQTNFRLAEADCSAALKIFTPMETPQEWAKALGLRGMIRRSLAVTLAMNQRGVGIRTMARHLLYQDTNSIIALLEERKALFEQALSDFSQALTILTRSASPYDWAKVLRERGLTCALQEPGVFSDTYETNMRRGILDLDNALSVFSHHETPYEWAITLSHRAILYGEFATRERRHDVAHALADTKAALTVMTRQVAPTNYCRLQLLRADLFIRLAQWSQAHEALLNARAAQRDLVAEAPGAQEQTDIIAQFALIDIYARDAWVMLQIEPVDHKAIAIALEEGRALVARMAFDLDTVRLDQLSPGEARERMAEFFEARDEWLRQQQRALHHPAISQEQDLSMTYQRYLQARKCIRELDNPDFMTPVPTMQQIGQALSGPEEALVYLIAGSPVTSIGGMASIVTRDVTRKVQANAMHLPELGELRLFNLFDVESSKTPRIYIDEALNTLGDMGLNEVTTLLLRQGIKRVRLVPYSWLGLFPLPSLLVTDPNGQRRHLSELFAEVTIVPSARSLEIARRGAQVQDHQRRALLIAGNPEPHPPEENLPFALAEAGALRRIARRYGYLEEHIWYVPPKEITRKHLMEKLPHARYAHLALHAEYCAGDPRSSRLILADINGANKQARNIYLGEVLDGTVNLRGMRLLTLSACETSIVDMQRVPNEVLGLAAGFLQAGASAVIASLWTVDDAATFLLMTQFAQFYLNPRHSLSPAAALAAAQHWLRAEATNLVLSTYDPALPKDTSSKLRSLTYDEARQKLQQHARQQREEGNAEVLPYADPFFWAGFVVMGL